MTDPKKALQSCVDELRIAIDEAMPVLTGVAPPSNDPGSATAAAALLTAAREFAETTRAAVDEFDRFIAELPNAE